MVMVMREDHTEWRFKGTYMRLEKAIFEVTTSCISFQYSVHLARGSCLEWVSEQPCNSDEAEGRTRHKHHENPQLSLWSCELSWPTPG